MLNEKEIPSELLLINPQINLESQHNVEGYPQRMNTCSKFISVQKVTFFGVCRINNQKGIY